MKKALLSVAFAASATFVLAAERNAGATGAEFQNLAFNEYLFQNINLNETAFGLSAPGAVLPLLGNSEIDNFVTWSFNDMLSSFVIQDGSTCVFYADINKGGNSFVWSGPVAVYYVGDVWNDQISSITCTQP